jgi:hypothetical protein
MPHRDDADIAPEEEARTIVPASKRPPPPRRRSFDTLRANMTAGDIAHRLQVGGECRGGRIK